MKRDQWLAFAAFVAAFIPMVAASELYGTGAGLLALACGAGGLLYGIATSP